MVRASGACDAAAGHGVAPHRSAPQELLPVPLDSGMRVSSSRTDDGRALRSESETKDASGKLLATTRVALAPPDSAA